MCNNLDPLNQTYLKIPQLEQFNFVPLIPREISHHILGMCTPEVLTKCRLVSHAWRKLANHVLDKNPRQRLVMLCSTLLTQLKDINEKNKSLLRETRNSAVITRDPHEKVRSVVLAGYKNVIELLESLELETVCQLDPSKLPNPSEYRSFIEGIRNRKLDLMIISARTDDFQGEINNLVSRICKLGLLDKAKELIPDIADQRYQVYAQTEIIKGLLEKDRIEEAQNMALSMPITYGSGAQDAVFETLLRLSLDRAYDFASSMKPSLLQSIKLNKLANIWMESGEYQKAFDAAKTIFRVPMKIVILKKLSEKLEEIRHPLEKEVRECLDKLNAQ